MDNYSTDEKNVSVTFALFCYFFCQRIISYSLLYRLTLFAIAVCEITVETNLPQQYIQPQVSFSDCWLLFMLEAMLKAAWIFFAFSTSCADDQIVFSPLAKGWAKGRKRTTSRPRQKRAADILWFLYYSIFHCYWQVFVGLGASPKACGE